MHIVCLDMEGVLVPEVWIAFARAQGIPELERTTRDEPNYRTLTEYRLGIMKEHGLRIEDACAAAARLEPFYGAREFLDELRSFTQVIIVSDIFAPLAKPLMEKLGYPTIFCNDLKVSAEGDIEHMLIRGGGAKLATIEALQQIDFETIAVGDSLNDLGMIKGSKAGFFFNASESIKENNPDVPAYETYADLMHAIKKALQD